MNLHRTRSISKQSSLFARRKRRQTIFRTIGIFFLVFGFVFLTSIITNLKSISISSIEVYGIDTETSVSIREKVKEKLFGKYIGLFSKSNVLIYPKETILAAIGELYPQIQRVDINLKDHHILSISVEEKIGQAVACIGLPEFEENRLILEKSERCYFVDQQGFIFSEAPLFSGLAYKRYYMNEFLATSSRANNIGAQVMSSEEFGKLEKFYDAVRQARMGAQAILIKPDEEYELYIENPVSPTTTEEFNPATIVVYFNAKSGFEEQLENLVSFWENQLSLSRASSTLPSFDSIDVRYGSNIFYRLIK